MVQERRNERQADTKDLKNRRFRNVKRCSNLRSDHIRFSIMAVERKSKEERKAFKNKRKRKRNNVENQEFIRL